ncbi:6-phosphofructokinase [Lachnoanaerobaculum sp.]
MERKNLIVGQSGGPTAAINSSLAGVYVGAKELGIDTVYGMRYGIEGLLKENIINLDDTLESELNVELLKRTPSSYLGSCRYKLPEVKKGDEVYERIFEILDKYNIGVFIYIGGNDSMDTIKKLSDYAKINGSEIRFVGVPKTIDNDLPVTDHTPGFGSAAKYIATSISEIVRDSNVYDLKSVTFVEIMGRNAGWLTAAAALAKNKLNDGPDFILLPEIGLDLKKFIGILSDRMQTKGNIVVAVSEGIKDTNGHHISEDECNVDAFGHKMLSGTAAFLAKKIKTELGVKTRAVEINTLQRAAAHLQSKTDIDEAFNIGFLGAKAGLDGNTGVMMNFERVEDSPYLSIVKKCDINLVANIEKKVPREWISEDGFYVNEHFIQYAKPLIMGELSNIVCDGIQSHIKSL